MPAGYAGQSIIILRNVLDDGLSFVHHGHLQVLHKADLIANSQRPPVKRSSETAPEAPSNSASDIEFAKTYQPIVDHDGGFQDEHKPTGKDI